jgi:hypothetical protein
MHKFCFLFLFFGALNSTSTIACENGASIEGDWILVADSTKIMKFKVEKNGDRNFEVEWSRPEKFNVSKHSFYNVEGPSVTTKAVSKVEFDNKVAVIFEDPITKKASVNFVLQLRDGTYADLKVLGSPSEDFKLQRDCSAAAFGNWDKNLRYNRTVYYQSNEELKNLFIEDQNDRKAKNLTAEQIRLNDEKRSGRLREMIDGGMIQSGRDFYYAAFLLQHGKFPADYLKAHSFAVMSLARNEPDAAWIAAASLDRYLMSIGQPQIYGTQTMAANDGGVTMEPYDRAVISDQLRAASNVPPLKEQEENVRKLKIQPKKLNSVGRVLCESFNIYEARGLSFTCS